MAGDGEPQLSQDAPRPEDFSLLPLSEVILPLLDAVGAGSVVEVGADRGDFTRELLDWASGAGASVAAVEPAPPAELERLAAERPELTLIREPSPEALQRVEAPDVVVLDGDHNHFTLSAELAAIEEGAGDSGMRLVLLHDVGWPHARRDTYYDPSRVPEAVRARVAEDVALAPGEPGVAPFGIRFRWAAESEGGEGNGVLTAVEDFMASRPELELAVVPAFFGLGILWSREAGWAGEVSRLVAPYDRSPMLARLEERRLAQIVQHDRLAHQEEVLRGLSGSRALALAERLSRLRRRDGPSWRERIARTLGS